MVLWSKEMTWAWRPNEQEISYDRVSWQDQTSHIDITHLVRSLHRLVDDLISEKAAGWQFLSQTHSGPRGFYRGEFATFFGGEKNYYFRRGWVTSQRISKELPSVDTAPKHGG